MHLVSREGRSTTTFVRPWAPHPLWRPGQWKKPFGSSNVAIQRLWARSSKEKKTCSLYSYLYILHTHIYIHIQHYTAHIKSIFVDGWHLEINFFWGFWMNPLHVLQVNRLAPANVNLYVKPIPWSSRKWPDANGTAQLGSSKSPKSDFGLGNKSLLSNIWKTSSDFGSRKW